MYIMRITSKYQFHDVSIVFFRVCQLAKCWWLLTLMCGVVTCDSLCCGTWLGLLFPFYAPLDVIFSRVAGESNQEHCHSWCIVCSLMLLPEWWWQCFVLTVTDMIIKWRYSFLSYRNITNITDFLPIASF